MSYRLPDAPYIREAERFGAERPEKICPVCGSACDKIYHLDDGRVAGCDVCGDFMLSWGMFPDRQEVDDELI